MARGKKKAADAPLQWEDVPEISQEEQPYPLPEGWKWVRLGDVNLYKGKILNPINEKNKTFELYSVPSSETNYPEIVKGKSIGSSKQEVEINDVLICKINPRINRVWFVEGFTENSLLASSEWIVFRNRSINPNYIRFYFSSPFFREYMMSNVSGVGGSLMRAQPKFVKTYPLPLPPLKTQQRIATAVESLFFQLDEAAEKVQAVIDSHEARKQAILHQAFSGELTRRWRKESGVSFESWKQETLGEYVRVQYGFTEKASAEKVGPKFLRITDIQNGTVDWGSVPYCKISKENYLTYKLNQGDIVIARTGATTGKSHLIQDAPDAVFASYLIRVVVTKPNILNEKFLYLFFQSARYWGQIEDLSAGIAQPGVNGNKLKTLTLPVPSLKEQHKILSLLTPLLIHLDKTTSLAVLIRDKIDFFKKALLNKAFRGELT